MISLACRVSLPGHVTAGWAGLEVASRSSQSAHYTYLAMGGTVCQARSLISVSLSPSLTRSALLIEIFVGGSLLSPLSSLSDALYPRYPSVRYLPFREFNLIKCFAWGSSCSRCLIRKKEAKVQEWRSALDKLVGLIFDCLDSQLYRIRILPWLHSISIITNDASIFYFY